MKVVDLDKMNQACNGIRTVHEPSFTPDTRNTIIISARIHIVTGLEQLAVLPVGMKPKPDTFGCQTSTITFTGFFICPATVCPHIHPVARIMAIKTILVIWWVEINTIM